MGDVLESVAALPRGSGVIFLHHSSNRAKRRMLLDELARLARRRRLLLFDGFAWSRNRKGAPALRVHSIPERIYAERAGAKLLFVSPVFATRSHPGARPLGRVRFGLLIRGAKLPVIALGGMTHARARSLAPFKIYGWAAIDGLTRQKRNAVPT